MTIFRLWRRQRVSHIWWDDAWAGLTAVIMVIWLPTFELMFRDSSMYHFIRKPSIKASRTFLHSLLLGSHQGHPLLPVSHAMDW